MSRSKIFYVIIIVLGFINAGCFSGLNYRQKTCKKNKRLVFQGIYYDDTLLISERNNLIVKRRLMPVSVSSIYLDTVINKETVLIKINNDTIFVINNCCTNKNVFIFEKVGQKSYQLHESVDTVFLLQ